MPVIGLTGNIGSGKSTVARRLEFLGAKIIDADQVAREVVMPGSPALEEIAGYFGRGVLDSAGMLDRKKMGAVVFSDARARDKLNKITHPRIMEAIHQEIDIFKESPDAAALVVDAPLLIEVGLHQLVDEVWVVKIDREEQVGRLAQRDGLAREDVLTRVAAQLPQEEKLNHARRVIDNSGNPAKTIEQVDRYWADFLKEYPLATAGI